MKPAARGGIVVMSIVEEHNHALVEGAERIFLRCNRKLSIVHQNFIMDCARANFGPTKAYTLAKEMAGSYEEIVLPRMTLKILREMSRFGLRNMMPI